MKKTIILILVLVCTVISCTNNVTPAYNASYIIDIDSVEPQDTFKISTLFKNVRTIILEDSDYAILGTVREIQIFDDEIFILDNRHAKKLFVYDKNGKYLRQIGSYGQGPGEYLEISDFAIDTDKKEIYTMDNYRQTVNKYKITGQYIKSIKLQQVDIYHKRLAFYNNKLYADICHFDYETNPNKYLLMEIDPETGESKEFLSVDYNLGFNRYANRDINVFLTKNRKEPLKYNDCYMNTVVAISGDSVRSHLALKTGAWARQSDIVDEKELERRKMFQYQILESRSRAFNIRNYINNNDCIFLEYYRDNKFFPVYYDKKTGKVSHYLRQKDDLTNLDLKILYSDSKYAYQYINPDERAMMKDFGVLNYAPNLDKREELMKLDDERIVIFEYEFR